jgi:hypothetical protein
MSSDGPHIDPLAMTATLGLDRARASSAFRPASTCFTAPMVCASVWALLLIRFFLSSSDYRTVCVRIAGGRSLALLNLANGPTAVWATGRPMSSRRSGILSYDWLKKPRAYMDPAFTARLMLTTFLRKHCEHISGLEVEGRRPRALMESALLLLNRSSASKAQLSIRFGRSRFYQSRHQCIRPAISMEELYAAAR